MRIVKEKYNIRCDMGTCRNVSKYAVEFDDNKRHNLHICSDCFNELYGIMGKELTPKSPENVVKKSVAKQKETI